ncbi:MAG TPA: TIM barrel protein [Usitatibacter sp.]|nr:TIM barrel protein [Usitatibacter sp.]
MLRFAANISWLFQELPFLERFAAARAAGFAAVEMRSPYEHPPQELAQRLRDNGLACVLFNLPMGDREQGDFGLACRPFREAEFRAGVEKAIEYARMLQAPRVNCIAGTIAPGEDRELLHDVLLENVRFAAEALGRAGVELAMEPVNSVDVPGYFVPRNADVVRVVEAVGAPNFGLQFDLYHTAMMGEDLAASFDALLPHIRHIQFADAPGRGEPGTGQSPIAAVLRHVAASKYAGWVSAEYRPTCETSRTLAWMRATW